MRTLARWVHTHRKIVIALVIAFFLVMTCCAFPIYNFTKKWSRSLTVSMFLIGIAVPYDLGTSMAFFFPKAKFRHMALISTAIIVAGMLCRWLLEYGEVSNTYNFTPANIALHLLMTVAISTLSWYSSSKHTK